MSQKKRKRRNRKQVEPQARPKYGLWWFVVALLCIGALVLAAYSGGRSRVAEKSDRIVQRPDNTDARRDNVSRRFYSEQGRGEYRKFDTYEEAVEAGVLNPKRNFTDTELAMLETAVRYIAVVEGLDSPVFQALGGEQAFVIFKPLDFRFAVGAGNGEFKFIDALYSPGNKGLYVGDRAFELGLPYLTSMLYQEGKHALQFEGVDLDTVSESDIAVFEVEANLQQIEFNRRWANSIQTLPFWSKEATTYGGSKENWIIELEVFSENLEQMVRYYEGLTDEDRIHRQ